MSRNINVNPGQYKVAGRERQGEDVVQTRERQRFAELRPKPPRRGRRRGKAGTTARPTR